MGSRCSGRFDILEVSEMFMFVLVETNTAGCVQGRGVEVGAKSGSICNGDCEAG